MAEHTIDFTHPDTGAASSETLDDTEFDEGPPEDPSDGGSVEFASLNTGEKLARWQHYFENGGNKASLEAARALARAAAPAVDNEAVVLAAQDAPDAVARRSIDVTRVDGGQTTTVTVQMSQAHYELGPPNALGRYDSTFNSFTDAQQAHTWDTWLSHNEFVPPPEDVPSLEVRDRAPAVADTPAAAQPSELAVAADGIDKVVNAADKKAKNPKKKGHKWSKKRGLALVLLSGGIVGIEELVRSLTASSPTPGVAPPPKPLPAPEPVTAAFVRNPSTGKPRVVVAWTAVPGAASYHVLLHRDGGEYGAPVAVSTTGHTFDNVADGQWIAVVQARSGAGEGGDVGHSPSVVVKASTPMTAPDHSAPKPGAPPTVTLEASFCPVSRVRGLRASWTAPVLGPTPTGYDVRLSGVAPAVAAVTRDGTGRNDLRWDEPADGTYKVEVRATNRGVAGDWTASSVVSFSRTASAAPNPPTDLTVQVFRSEADQAAAVRVMWNRAAAGAGTARYVVALGDRTQPIDTPSQSAVFRMVADGDWTVTVRAANTKGMSTAANTTVHVDDAAIDDTALDWEALVGPQQRTAWASAVAPIGTLDEVQDFWPTVMAALGPAGSASWADQLVLARVLPHWVTVPSNLPSATQLTSLASSLAGDAGVPTTAMQPLPAPTLAVWQHGAALTDMLGSPVPMRWKLFAITRVLEDLLGVPHSIPNL